MARRDNRGATGMRGWRGAMLVAAAMVAGCDDGEFEADPYDLDFDIPRTEAFADSLTAYDLYQEPLAALQPAVGALPYELSSQLFTDYASKQRLLRVPPGTKATVGPEGELVYPEGTILVKTFYYPSDMRDDDAPKRVIETRLLVKRMGLWNVATYLWNDAQTDATLWLEGTATEASWIDEAGEPRGTTYAVPHEGECVTCHQRADTAAFIGPTLRNLNRTVERDGAAQNQIAFLRSAGALDAIDEAAAPTIPNYDDPTLDLSTRARAYLDANCAHCHNPVAWEQSADNGLDFRFDTPLPATGIPDQIDAMQRQLNNGDMPFLGTTLRHDEGVQLVLDYLATL